MAKNKSRPKSTPYKSGSSNSPRIESPAKISWVQTLPVLAFTCITILIVHMREYESLGADLYFMSSNLYSLDFFSLAKSQFVLLVGVLSFAILLSKFFAKSLSIKENRIYIPMAIYTVFVILSFVFSDSKEIAGMGWNERFEGTFILVIYMLMLFYIINFTNSEKQVKVIITGVAIISVILGFLGLTQYFGSDFFQTDIGKMLILPVANWNAETFSSLKFAFTDGQIYQTVYNINYVSFYLTLLVPLFGLLFMKASEIWPRIIYGVLFLLALFNMIGSVSSGGIIGLLASFIIAIIILNKTLLQWKKPIAITLGITVIIGAFTFPAVSTEIKNTINMTLGTYVQDHPELQPKSTIVDYIDTQENGLVLSINEETLVVVATDITNPANSGVLFYDKDNNPIALTPSDDGSYILDDERFSMCSFELATDSATSTYYVLFTIENELWTFALLPEGVFYLNDLGKIVDLEITPSVGFEENLMFGSSRGYIWSRSIPMIKDTILVGNGADTYCAYFPQNDYIGKLHAGLDKNLIIDKPHNMYLGIAINTGLVSLIAYLAIMLTYIVQCFKTYFKRRDYDYLATVGVGIFIGIVGFLISGLVNDSNVSVMPLFYGLLGTGIAINMMIKKRDTISS